MVFYTPTVFEVVSVRTVEDNISLNNVINYSYSSIGPTYNFYFNISELESYSTPPDPALRYRSTLSMRAYYPPRNATIITDFTIDIILTGDY